MTRRALFLLILGALAAIGHRDSAHAATGTAANPQSLQELLVLRALYEARRNVWNLHEEGGIADGDSWQRGVMVRSAGLEPATPSFEGWCSIQLSYERARASL